MQLAHRCRSKRTRYACEGDGRHGLGDGQPWTISRSAQAFDWLGDLDGRTAWTAFQPPILRVGSAACCTGERGSWDVPSTLYAATDSPFLLRKRPSSRPSRPDFNNRAAFRENMKPSGIVQCRPFRPGPTGIFRNHPNTWWPKLPFDRIREFRISRLGSDHPPESTERGRTPRSMRGDPCIRRTLAAFSGRQ
jgi:hypothetical protein